MDPHVLNFGDKNQLHAPAALSPVPTEQGLGWVHRRSVYLGPGMEREGERQIERKEEGQREKTRPNLCYESQRWTKTVV